MMKASYSDTVEVRSTSTALDIYINGIHQEANKSISQFHKGLHCNVILNLFCVDFLNTSIGVHSICHCSYWLCFNYPFSCATIYRIFGENIISSV